MLGSETGAGIVGIPPITDGLQRGKNDVTVIEAVTEAKRLIREGRTEMSFFSESRVTWVSFRTVECENDHATIRGPELGSAPPTRCWQVHRSNKRSAPPTADIEAALSLLAGELGSGDWELHYVTIEPISTIIVH